jgi:DUF1365 family protein
VTARPSRSGLLVGRVSHSRLAPRPHAFAYELFMLRIDLDEVAALDARLRGFGTRWWKAIRFEPADFMGLARGRQPVAARVSALRAKVIAALAAHGVAAPIGRIELVAHGRIAGYVFNPVSFFACYAAADGTLAGVVADVHNTFGERHAYVLPVAAAASDGAWHENKVFHVSPFFTLDGTYRFAMTFADDGVDIRIDLHADGRPVFVSALRLAQQPLTDRAIVRALTRFPAMTARVIGAIHWEALRLWRKGLPYLSKPAYDPARARGATRA